MSNWIDIEKQKPPYHKEILIFVDRYKEMGLTFSVKKTSLTHTDERGDHYVGFTMPWLVTKWMEIPDPTGKTILAECPDCGGTGTDHKSECLHEARV